MGEGAWWAPDDQIRRSLGPRGDRFEFVACVPSRARLGSRANASIAGGVGPESSQAQRSEYELRDVEPAQARALLLAAERHGWELVAPIATELAVRRRTRQGATTSAPSDSARCSGAVIASPRRARSRRRRHAMSRSAPPTACACATHGGHPTKCPAASGVMGVARGW